MVVYIHRGPEKVTRNHRRYWLALGRFIHAFALMEGQVFTLLFEKIGVDRSTAKALFSGTRAEDAISKLRRLAEVRETPIPEQVDRAFQQLSAINTARNKIVHYGATLHDGAFLVTDANRNIARATYGRQFPPETIDQMTADLDTIAAALYVWLIGPKAQSWDHLGINWRERGLAPWQYTPPEQDKPRQQNPGNARKRELRPKASRR